MFIKQCLHVLSGVLTWRSKRLSLLDSTHTLAQSHQLTSAYMLTGVERVLHFVQGCAQEHIIANH
jgi:hypothetical protein